MPKPLKNGDPVGLQLRLWHHVGAQPPPALDDGRWWPDKHHLLTVAMAAAAAAVMTRVTRMIVAATRA